MDLSASSDDAESATNDLHRAIRDKDWGRAGALLGLGEGADPHPDAKRRCAETDNGRLPLHWALQREAPEGVALGIIDIGGRREAQLTL